VLLSPLASAGEKYRSAFDAAFSPDGKLLAVSDRTAKSLVFFDVAGKKIACEAELKGGGNAVAWAADGSKVYVAEYEADSVAEVDASGKVLRHLPTGVRPVGVALKGGLLVVANSFTDNVSIINVASGKQEACVAVPRNPYFVAVSPTAPLAVVGNLLPAMPAVDPDCAAAITLIDLEKFNVISSILLPAGSTSVRKVLVSPDGKWAYVAHTLGRTSLPTTQLERGWINTNALTIIDLTAKAQYATVLLDRLSEGASDPWGLALSKDGNTLWVSLAGVRRVQKVDMGSLHKLLAGGIAEVAAEKKRDPTTAPVWQEIKKDPKQRAALANDLAALYAMGLTEKFEIPGDGPRGMDVSADGKTVAVATYFTGEAVLFDGATGKVEAKLPLGAQPTADLVRQGEMLFHDGITTYQNWLSCVTCHPSDQRADGLNWDLLNDGIGNPKNTKSLVYAHLTPPTTWQGARANMEASVLGGFKHIKFRVPTEQEVNAVQAYLRSLKPDASPFLKDGKMSDLAKKGEKIFKGDSAKCGTCHTGEYHTDLKEHDVGTKRSFDNTANFFTPTLLEVWRTRPYLHDGSAATLKDVITKMNPNNEHGVTSGLSAQDIDALVEYLNSL
jgi:DNA-binding beta-propeller fold protein YncE